MGRGGHSPRGRSSTNPKRRHATDTATTSTQPTREVSTTQTIAGALVTLVTLVAIVAGVMFLRTDPPALKAGQVAIVERVIDGDTFTVTTARI